MLTTSPTDIIRRAIAMREAQEAYRQSSTKLRHEAMRMLEAAFDRDAKRYLEMIEQTPQPDPKQMDLF